MTSEAIINKTLNLAELERQDYSLIAGELKDLIAVLTAKGLKFTTYQAEFDTGWGENNIWFKRKLWEICNMAVGSGVGKEHRVLDCGGASTIFSFYLASKGCRVDTVDIDWRNFGIVENANTVAKAMNWQMDNLKASMTDLPYGNEVFDRVFTVCVLEHLPCPDQLKAVKEMARVLKPGGIAGLTFDYGPNAFGESYISTSDINKRIIEPSGLNIFGNHDYRENIWFDEQAGKTWGAIFLEKTDTIPDKARIFLFCSLPQSRPKVKLFLSLKCIKDVLYKMGINRSNRLYLFLKRLKRKQV